MKALFFTIFTIILSPVVHAQDQGGKPVIGGDNFIGMWHSLTAMDTITISKNGDNYDLLQKGKIVTLTYCDEVLKSDDASLGKAIFNSMSGHVFWQKKDYEFLGPVPAPNTSSNVAYYALNSVGNFLNDRLSSPESVLFQIVSDYQHPNKMVLLDYNFHESTENYQLIANAVFHGIENTHRVKRIFSDKYMDYANDTIFYFVSYSNMDAHTLYVGALDKDGNPLPSYVGYVSFDVLVTDADGKRLCGNSFKFGYKPLERVHFPAFTTEQQAIKHASAKLSEQVRDYFNDRFQVVTTVSSVNEAGRDGNAKTIVMKGGEDMGISEQSTFKIMYADKQIGEVKVKSVDDHSCICKVLDGGDVISANIAAGKTMDAIME